MSFEQHAGNRKWLDRHFVNFPMPLHVHCSQPAQQRFSKMEKSTAVKTAFEGAGMQKQIGDWKTQEQALRQILKYFFINIRFESSFFSLLNWSQDCYLSALHYWLIFNIFLFLLTIRLIPPLIFFTIFREFWECRTDSFEQFWKDQSVGAKQVSNAFTGMRFL